MSTVTISRKEEGKKKEGKKMAAVGEGDNGLYGEAGGSFVLVGLREKRKALSPSWDGEFACLCLAYLAYERLFLVSKAPFFKITCFHSVREHSADMLCVLWKEKQI